MKKILIIFSTMMKSMTIMIVGLATLLKDSIYTQVHKNIASVFKLFCFILVFLFL